MRGKIVENQLKLRARGAKKRILKFRTDVANRHEYRCANIFQTKIATPRMDRNSSFPSKRQSFDSKGTFNSKIFSFPEIRIPDGCFSAKCFWILMDAECQAKGNTFHVQFKLC